MTDHSATSALHWRPSGGQPNVCERRTTVPEQHFWHVMHSRPGCHSTVISCAMLVQAHGDIEAAWRQARLRIPMLGIKHDTPEAFEVPLLRTQEQLQTWTRRTLKRANVEPTLDGLLAYKRDVSGGAFPNEHGDQVELHVLSNGGNVVGLLLRISHAIVDARGALGILKTVLQVIGDVQCRQETCDVAEQAEHLVPGMPALLPPRSVATPVRQRESNSSNNSAVQFEMQFPREHPPQQYAATTTTVVHTFSKEASTAIRQTASGAGVSTSQLLYATWLWTMVSEYGIPQHHDSQPAAAGEVFADKLALDVRSAFPNSFRDPAVSAGFHLTSAAVEINLHGVFDDRDQDAPPPSPLHERILILAQRIKDAWSPFLSSEARAEVAWSAFERESSGSTAMPPAFDDVKRTPRLQPDGNYEYTCPRTFHQTDDHRASAEVHAIVMGLDHGPPSTLSPLSSRCWTFRERVWLSCEANDAVFGRRELQDTLAAWADNVNRMLS